MRRDVSVELGEQKSLKFRVTKNFYFNFKVLLFLKVYKHSVIERVGHCISFYSLKHKKQSFDHTKITLIKSRMAYEWCVNVWPTAFGSPAPTTTSPTP